MGRSSNLVSLRIDHDARRQNWRWRYSPAACGPTNSKIENSASTTHPLYIVIAVINRLLLSVVSIDLLILFPECTIVPRRVNGFSWISERPRIHELECFEQTLRTPSAVQEEEIKP